MKKPEPNVASKVNRKSEYYLPKSNLPSLHGSEERCNRDWLKELEDLRDG
jgi:hypothetical protein